MVTDYYDRQGKPLTMEQWIPLFEDSNYKIVKQDYIPDGIGQIKVSTVWLGLNHSRIGEGPPLIFETLIFGGEYDQEMYRYTTEDQALAGHEIAVDLVKVNVISHS